jgi:hypothetical protein
MAMVRMAKMRQSKRDRPNARRGIGGSFEEARAHVREGEQYVVCLY